MPHKTAWEDATSILDSTNSDNPALSENVHTVGKCSCVTADASPLGHFRRRQSQLSGLAKQAMTTQSAINQLQRQKTNETAPDSNDVDQLRNQLDRTLHIDSDSENAASRSHPNTLKTARTQASTQRAGSLAAALHGHIPEVTGATIALNDTPAPTAPSSPRLNGNTSSQNSSEASGPITIGPPVRQNSGSSTPRVRPTTLDIPGLTKSKVSPDGRISSRDVGAKLVIVMVGLPARGKSYITKKLARYLNWLQHDTRIFNVGERRRVVAGGPHTQDKQNDRQTRENRGFTASSPTLPVIVEPFNLLDSTTLSSAPVTGNRQEVEAPATLGTPAPDEPSYFATQVDDDERHVNDLRRPDMGEPTSPRISRRTLQPQDDTMEQNAAFFDPDNQKASQIREQVARETLDELLDFILYENGSVGILDATNSTIERRKMVMDRIRERAGPDLNVLFLESRCVDLDLLEANMRLKLSGPDYKKMDPTIALADFKKRVQAYEKAYVPLGDYEEMNHMPYIQMIDVGRKIISHQIKGFLSAQANYYLLNFNLAPRQIWITRHGLSTDNISGKIGGDSELASEGHQYARSLAKFMDQKRKEWDEKQRHSLKHSHFPPLPGDVTPPNPYYHASLPSQLPDSLDLDPSQQIPAPPTSSNTSAPSTPPAEYEPKNFCVWTSMLRRSIQTAAHFNDEDYEIKQMRMLDELNAGVMEGLTYSCISSQYPDEFASRKRDKLHYRYPGPGGEGYLDIINRLRPVIVELERMTDHVLLVGHRSVARVLLAYFRGLKREEVADLDVPLGMLYCLEPKPYGVDFKAYAWDRQEEWFYEVPDFVMRRARNDMQ